jgi:hypothetical protein
MAEALGAARELWTQEVGAGGCAIAMAGAVCPAVAGDWRCCHEAVTAHLLALIGVARALVLVAAANWVLHLDLPWGFVSRRCSL